MSNHPKFNDIVITESVAEVAVFLAQAFDDYASITLDRNKLRRRWKKTRRIWIGGTEQLGKAYAKLEKAGVVTRTPDSLTLRDTQAFQRLLYQIDPAFIFTLPEEKEGAPADQ